MVTGGTSAIAADVIGEVSTGGDNARSGAALRAKHGKDGKKMGRV